MIVAFWVATVITVFLTTLRRAFLDTPEGFYHPRFLALQDGADFDEADKLHRINVVLTVTVQFFRVLWVVLWAQLRLIQSSNLGYLPEAWKGLEWLPILAVTLELVIMSTIALDLFPQVISSWCGRKISLAVLPTLARVETVFSPLSRSFRWLRSALLRFVDSNGEQSEAILAEEGIRAAMEIGEREGVLKPGEKSMIESMLEFDELEIVEVMTPRTDMVCLERAVSVEEAIAMATECGHSRIPVYEEDIDHITGVLYVKDLLRYVGDGHDEHMSIDSVSRKINFVPETKLIRDLLAEFRAERFHIAVVLDEYGGTSGLVTIEDILEEIVGEIDDEYDDASLELIQKVDPTTFDLDGRAPIDDVNEVTGAELPESDDYETVAGFLMSSLGRVPQEGDHYDFEHVRFEVMAADERKVKRVRIHQQSA